MLRGQRTTCGSQSSPTIKWVPRVKHSSPGSATASTFTFQTSALSYLLICLFGFEAGPRCAAFAGLGRPFCLSFDTVLLSSASPRIRCSRGLSGTPALPSPPPSAGNIHASIVIDHMPGPHACPCLFPLPGCVCPSLPFDVLQKSPSQKTTLMQPPTFVLSQGTCQINQRRHKKKQGIWLWARDWGN